MEPEGEKKEQVNPPVTTVSQEPVIQTLLMCKNLIIQKSETL